MTNQTAIETKEFQQAEPTAEQIAIHQADRCEERMKVATISEQTRRIIVLMGKVMDVYGEVSFFTNMWRNAVRQSNRANR